MKKLQKILVIVGPTASGKTAFAIQVAKKIGGEIVSADSRQIYRGMDIGTAKPPLVANGYLLMANGIPHHLMDIRNPNEEYSVADFKQDAIKAIRDILKQGKVPIIVGGTGLYVKAVVDNLDIPKIKADQNLRKKLENELKENSLGHLFKKLVELDSEAAYIVDPKNPRRVVRALEVAIATGKPFTAQRKKDRPLFEFLQIGIKAPPEILRERIDKRIDAMVKNGLVEEVRHLYKKYGRVKAFDAIGYREIIDCFSGKISLEESIRLMKLNTWRYAKRQMTWFRKNKNIKWIEKIDIDQIEDILK